MNYAVILFDNGTWNHTSINGTDEEICQYYWQFTFNPVRSLFIHRSDIEGETTFTKYDNPNL